MDMTLLFPILILLLFIPIFLSGRKQKRQVAETQRLQNSLAVGDVVTTTSGLRGTVTDISYEDTIDLEVADGVVTTWLRAAVRDKVAVDEHTDEHPTDEPETTALGSTTSTSANGSTGNGVVGNGSSNGSGPTDAVVEPVKDPAADDKK